jgi:hypothetical protein
VFTDSILALALWKGGRLSNTMKITEVGVAAFKPETSRIKVWKSY